MAKKKRVPYVANKAWEIYPIPLLMTDMEVRVQFYTKGSDEVPSRHVANGVKNRLDDRYTVMLARGERQKLTKQYGMSVNDVYRFFDSELRRVVAMMESHPEKYVQNIQTVVDAE